MPSLRPFGAWSCAYDPGTALDCDVTEGFLSAAFSIVDPPGGGQQHGVVQFETVADTSIDLTGFKSIAFDVRLTPAPPTSPSGGPSMRLQLRCSTAVDENGAVLRDYAVVQRFPYTEQWSSPTPLDLRNFGPPADLPGTLPGGLFDCLRAVDGFQFVFDPQAADGDTVTGVLSIDNVRLLLP